jgi:hypothetical protein
MKHEDDVGAPHGRHKATSVGGVLGLTAASTGASERALWRNALCPRRPANPPRAAVLEAGRRLLGAQAGGLEGVDALVLGVREPAELPAGLPDGQNMPLSQLRLRYAERPRDRDIWIYCGVASAGLAR